jgi:hypothetical protein
VPRPGANAPGPSHPTPGRRSLSLSPSSSITDRPASGLPRNPARWRRRRWSVVPAFGLHAVTHRDQPLGHHAAGRCEHGHRAQAARNARAPRSAPARRPSARAAAGRPTPPPVSAPAPSTTWPVCWPQAKKAHPCLEHESGGPHESRFRIALGHLVASTPGNHGRRALARPPPGRIGCRQAGTPGARDPPWMNPGGRLVIRRLASHPRAVEEP